MSSRTNSGVGEGALDELRRLVAVRQDRWTLRVASFDSGWILERQPQAVLAPTSVSQVVNILKWANRHRCPLKVRGTGHTQGGQALAQDGVVMDMRGLDRIGGFDEATVQVEGGVQWRSLVRQTLARGCLPRVLTNNLDTTVAGTLSTAGLGSASHRYGMQVDNVTELEVVTGAGRLLRCSRQRHRELFDAVRCGMGEFGVIVGARIRLRPVPAKVRTYSLMYDDLQALLGDQRALMERFMHLRAWCRHSSQRFVPPEHAGPWGADLRYPLHASIDLEAEPQAQALLAGLGHARLLQVRDQDQMAFADLREPSTAIAMRIPPQELGYPVTECMLPTAAVPELVERLFEALPATLLPHCNMIVRPMLRGAIDAPMLMLPRSDQIIGFGVLPFIPRGAMPLAASVLKRVGRLMASLGGKRYLTGWIRFSHDDWRGHYGEHWPRVLRRKAEFDPQGVLNPGFVRYQP